MWKARVFSNGRWDECQVWELSNEPFTPRAILGVAQKFPNILVGPMLGYLNQEAETGSLTGRSAIETWAHEAELEAKKFSLPAGAAIKQVDEAIAYYPPVAGAGMADTPASLAWHDHTAVIVKLTGEEEQVILEYTPGPIEEDRVERLRNRYASPTHKLETIFDWRGYFGTNSAVVDGWKRMPGNGHSFTVNLRAKTGYLVGAVLRRLSVPQPALSHDPTARRRLIAMTQRYPDIAERCQDLAAASAATLNTAVVFVHGTLSCGIQGLKDLLAPFPPPAAVFPHPIYRFEHDTFRPIDENATELARLVQERLRTKDLLIVAHSRGGMVGRLALSRLERSGYQGNVRLYTFGTPHQGTPLIGTADYALNLLWRLGEDFIVTLPVLPPLNMAYSFLTNFAQMPQGLDDMRENTTVMDLLQYLNDRDNIWSFGSRFDYQKVGTSGFGIEFEGLLAGLFGEIANDLVVPTGSCLSAGMPQPALDCSHINYFSQPMVRAAITAFPAPPPN